MNRTITFARNNGPVRPAWGYRSVADAGLPAVDLVSGRQQWTFVRAFWQMVGVVCLACRWSEAVRVVALLPARPLQLPGPRTRAHSLAEAWLLFDGQAIEEIERDWTTELLYECAESIRAHGRPEELDPASRKTGSVFQRPKGDVWRIGLVEHESGDFGRDHVLYVDSRGKLLVRRFSDWQPADRGPLPIPPVEVGEALARALAPAEIMVAARIWQSGAWGTSGVLNDEQIVSTDGSVIAGRYWHRFA